MRECIGPSIPVQQSLRKVPRKGAAGRPNQTNQTQSKNNTTWKKNTADTEIMDLSEESKEAQQEHARLLKQVEAERRARTMVVPTKTEDVAKKLR